MKVGGQVSSLEKLWHKRAYRSWWLPVGEGSAPPKTWLEVLEQASLDWENDPIRRAERSEFRKAVKSEILAFYALTIVAICAFSMGLDYIVDPHIPGLSLFPTNSGGDSSKINVGDLVQASTNLTAYLAIITAGIAVYVARFTLRAQVRSKSRQEWIDRFINLIASIVSEIDRKFQNEETKTTNEVNEKIIHLELMLNPSEKDHRILAMLLRICIHPQAPVAADTNIQVKLSEIQNKNQAPSGSEILFKVLLDKKLKVIK